MAMEPMDIVIAGQALNSQGFEAFNTISGIGLNTFGFLWGCPDIWTPTNDFLLTTGWTATQVSVTTTWVSSESNVATHWVSSVIPKNTEDCVEFENVALITEDGLSLILQENGGFIFT